MNIEKCIICKQLIFYSILLILSACQQSNDNKTVHNSQTDNTMIKSTEFLSDIPENIARVLIKISILTNIIQTGSALTSHYIVSAEDLEIPAPSLHQLQIINKRLSYYYDRIHSLLTMAVPQYPEDNPTRCTTIKSSPVCFIEPGHLLQNIQQQWPLIESSIYDLTYSSDDWHNFIVFYLKMRLAHIKNSEPVAPPNIKTHPVAMRLTAIFKHADSFQHLDRYLQENGFRKDPVLRGWIFTTIYFDYVRQAFNKGYINMALREFLEGITREMCNEIPEIAAQKNYLVLLQRYKLIK